MPTPALLHGAGLLVAEDDSLAAEQLGQELQARGTACRLCLSPAMMPLRFWAIMPCSALLKAVTAFLRLG